MNHFAAIGLPTDDQSAFGALMERAIALGVEEAAAPSSRHVRWTDPSGASIAFHVDGDSIACATPYFAPPDGPTRWRIHTTAATDDPDCPHCGGADCDIVDGDGETITRSTVQWLYSAAYREWLARERTFDLEVVAFAHDAGFYDRGADFEAAQARIFGDHTGPGDKPLRLAEASFLPEGMFAPPGGRIGDRSTVLFAGTVDHVATRTNTLTGLPFLHVRVATLPGPIDVVATPGETDDDPALGRIALIRAWLVGRPTEPPPSPAERSWLRRIFAR